MASSDPDPEAVAFYRQFTHSHMMPKVPGLSRKEFLCALANQGLDQPSMDEIEPEIDAARKAR